MDIIVALFSAGSKYTASQLLIIYRMWTLPIRFKICAQTISHPYKSVLTGRYLSHQTPSQRISYEFSREVLCVH